MIHERRCVVMSGEDRGRASNSGAAAAATQLQRQWQLHKDHGGNYSSSSSNDGSSGHVGRTETGWAHSSPGGRDGVQVGAMECGWARWSAGGAIECRRGGYKYSTSPLPSITFFLLIHLLFCCFIHLFTLLVILLDVLTVSTVL